MRSRRSVTASDLHSKHRIRVRPLRERRAYTQPSPRRPGRRAAAPHQGRGAPCSAGVLNRAQYPSDVIALVVLWRLRYKLSLRDLPEIFAVRGIVFSYEAVREWEAKLTPALAEDLRRRRRGQVGRSWHVDETDLKVHGRCAISIAPSTGTGTWSTYCSASTGTWKLPRRSFAPPKR